MDKIQLTRWVGNPLLKPNRRDSHWWESGSVFNPGVVVRGSKIYLLYRAMGGIHFSQLGLAVLSDPVTIEKRLPYPVFFPEEGNTHERFGVEDPRIVYIKDRYWIVYIAASVHPFRGEVTKTWGRMGVPWRIRCSLATTRDFIYYQRRGVPLPGLDTKDGTLFPEKVDGRYVMLHRVFPHIWISFSEKSSRFSKGEILCRVRKKSWDNSRIGAGAPPIKTHLGWLEFYHGVHEGPDKKLTYMIGILLLDLKDPRKVLYRSPEPVLVPEAKYETTGYVNNVVFPCGAIVWKSRYYVYYGAADRCIGVAYISRKKLLDFLSKKI
ncbi:MAG TPA: glycosidase [Candidatus Bathyarchaeia archaeon]|nr:glycosidase [Candidatus Bathyarchaeia archaeon]